MYYYSHDRVFTPKTARFAEKKVAGLAENLVLFQILG